MPIPPIHWHAFPWISEYSSPYFPLFCPLNPLFQPFKRLPNLSFLHRFMDCFASSPDRGLVLFPSIHHTRRKIISLSYKTLVTSATIHQLNPATIIVCKPKLVLLRLDTSHGYISSFPSFTRTFCRFLTAVVSAYIPIWSLLRKLLSHAVWPIFTATGYWRTPSSRSRACWVPDSSA